MYAAMTKAAILDAARSLFVSRGFDATSVDDIARESQVSKGAVYHHFQDKQEVFVEVYRGAEQAVVAAVAEAVAQPGLQPWEQIETATRAALHAYATDHAARVLMRQAPQVIGQDRTRELDAELALPLVTGLLAEMARLGELRSVDLDSAALLVFHLVSDAAMTITMAPDPDAALSAVTTVMLNMLGGLRQPPA